MNANQVMYDYRTLISEAEKNAAHGCGASDVLYASRLQVAFEGILEGAPEELKDEVLQALKDGGFEEEWEPFVADAHECSMTGIDIDCCPCGRHE